MDIAKIIDHTLLKPNATQADIEKLCKEADAWQFASVCINPSWVSFAAEQLADSDVKVCTVIGFPLGATTSETKAFEASQAVENGADEVDMVINVGRLIEGDTDYVKRDIEAVVHAVNDNTIVKVILETCLLTPEQIKVASTLAVEAGADFVKTSTGFSTGGATVEAVKLMHETVGDKALVKASGGIRTFEDTMNMIRAGASRIGTSNGVGILGGKE